MKNVIKADELVTLDAHSLLWTYQDLNPLGFMGPAVLVRVVNDSYEPIYISFDGGATEHHFLGTKSELEIETQFNSAPNSNTLKFSKGTIVSVASAGSLKGGGTISLSSYYIET